MGDSWANYMDRSSRYYSEPRNHCLAPGGSEYGRYLWVSWHIRRGERVLDVGCNCGQLAENLTKDLSCQVIGVDVIPDFVRYCRREKAAFGKFYCADFGKMRIRPSWIGAFDVVTALEVIEHAIDVRAFLVNVLLALKPNGELIITTPHPDGLMGYKALRQNPTHWRMWTRWRLAQVFGPMSDYAEINRDECGRLLSIGAVFRKPIISSIQEGV